MTVVSERAKARILVIDDCQTVFHSIVGALGLSTFEIDRMELFVQLPRILKKSPPDLIILDINIPGLSGVRIGELIRKYQVSSIPVIIYSSCAEEDRVSAAQKVGAVGQVSKGASPEALIPVVYRALEKGDRPFMK